MNKNNRFFFFIPTLQVSFIHGSTSNRKQRLKEEENCNDS